MALDTKNKVVLLFLVLHTELSLCSFCLSLSLCVCVCLRACVCVRAACVNIPSQWQVPMPDECARTNACVCPELVQEIGYLVM